MWVFAWIYVSSVVSPARCDIFVTSQGTDSYYLAGTTTTTAATAATITITTAATTTTTTTTRVVGAYVYESVPCVLTKTSRRVGETIELT